MPAIQPEALEREIASLLDLVGDPGLFVRNCMSLLDYYADRTRRTGMSPVDAVPERVMRVPRPVLRSLCAAIHRRGRGEAGETWIDAARALWGKRYRETRLIAICLLRESELEALADIAGEWGEEAGDPEVIQALAREGLRALREQDLETYLETIAAWLSSERRQALALHALSALLDMKEFDQLPRVFRLLQAGGEAIGARAISPFRELLQRLARRSPHETAAYLMAELNRRPSVAARMVKWVLPELPRPLRVDLQRATARSR